MKKILLLSVFALYCHASYSQERPFARTFAANIIHPGTRTIELLHTSRFGHAGESYHAMDQYLEFEIGLNHRLQAAFGLSRYQVNSDHLENLQHQYDENGFNTEWKWRLNDPGKKTGFALFGDAGLKGPDLAIEARFIADHNFGKSLLALNLGYEWEKSILHEEEGEEKHIKAPLELDIAYMYHLNHCLGAGFELVNCNDLAGKRWNNSILFAGPTINYSTHKWFILANYLPQLVNLHKTSYSPGKKVLTDHEKGEARIIIGLSF
jgi:hypothetical protein